MKTLRALILLAALPLSSCISFSGLDPASNYADVGDESIFVLGISPRYRVHIFEGERAGEKKWNRDQLMTKLNVYPESGYIVARVPARTGAQNYGIGGILPEGIGGGRVLIPCVGRTTITFDAPRGKVVYVANVTFIDSGSTARYEVSSEFEAARAHLKARYPLLADRLVDQGYENPVLANTACERGPGAPIVIYLPRVRR